MVRQPLGDDHDHRDVSRADMAWCGVVASFSPLMTVGRGPFNWRVVTQSDGRTSPPSRSLKRTMWRARNTQKIHGTHLYLTLGRGRGTGRKNPLFGALSEGDFASSLDRPSNEETAKITGVYWAVHAEGGRTPGRGDAPTPL